jgi:hypothetical protein
VTFQWVTGDSNRKILPVSDPLGRLSARTRISLPSQIGRAPNPANMKTNTIGFCFYQAIVSEKFMSGKQFSSAWGGPLGAELILLLQRPTFAAAARTVRVVKCFDDIII